MAVRISAILGRNPRFQSVRESLMRFVSGNRSYTAFRPRFQAFRRTPCERPSDALPFDGEGGGSNPRTSAGQFGRIRRCLA